MRPAPAGTLMWPSAEITPAANLVALRLVLQAIVPPPRRL